MTGVSVPSPAILKKDTGAANVGTVGGDTVQQWVTAFNIAMGNVEGDVSGLQSFIGGLMPKSGGVFTGDIVQSFSKKYKLRVQNGSAYDFAFISTSTGRMVIGDVVFPEDLVIAAGEGKAISLLVGTGSPGNEVANISSGGIKLGSGSRCDLILDQDNFSSNSATALATQQSIKAYVDNSVAAVPSPGLVLISSADITTPVAAIDLVLGGYDEYIIELMNVIPDVQGAELYVKTSSDGGASFDSGAADYSYKVYSDSNYGLDSIGRISVIQGNLGVSSAHSGYCGSVRVSNPHESGATHIYGIFSYVAKTGALTGGNMLGIRHEKAAVDAIRFYFDSGNVASGKVAIYGVNR